MKRIISVLLSVIFILLIFSGCTEKGSDEQLIFPIDDEPRYLDPQIATGASAQNIIANCFEGLVGFDENSKIIPAAAESYDISSDSMTYTFKLRKNMKWKLSYTASKLFEENEKPDLTVTADDFIFGLRRAVRQDTNSPYATLLKSIENASEVNSGKLDEEELGVYKTDDYTLVIELENPDCDFLYTLTMPMCMPCDEEFFEKTGGRYGLSPEYLIYNGPFYISNWAEGTAISTRKNEDYHSADSVKPYSIYFSINNAFETRGEKVQNGTYQVAPVDSTQKAELAKSKNITVRDFSNSMNVLLLNCSDEVLKNASIRKAIVSAFDVNSLLEMDSEERAKGIVPSGCLANEESYRERIGELSFLPFDKEQAKAYYNEGINRLDVKDIDLTVLCSTDDEYKVRNLMQQWQSAFGVSFSIGVEVVDTLTLNDRIKSGNYQLAIADISFSNSTALNCLMSFCSDNSNNVFGLHSEKYDEMIESVKKTTSTSDYISILKKAEYYLIACAVIAPICEKQTHQGIAKGVEGLNFSPSGEIVYFRNGLKK